MLYCRLRSKEACDEWSSDTYRMLLLCSSKTCNKHCIDEGATRGKCGFLIFRPFCFCTKLKNATKQSHLSCNGDFPFSAVTITFWWIRAMLWSDVATQIFESINVNPFCQILCEVRPNLHLVGYIVSHTCCVIARSGVLLCSWSVAVEIDV